MSKKLSPNTNSANNILLIAAANSPPTGSVTYSGYAAYATGTQTMQTLTATNTLADADGLGPISYTWTTIDPSTHSVMLLGALGTYTLQTGTNGSLIGVGTKITLTASYTDGNGNAEAVSTQITVGQQTNGSTGNDSLTGTVGDDIIYGDAGDDTISGGTSGAGNDYLSGGDGNDHIQDNLGNDTLLGGNGDDTLVSAGNIGTNTDMNKLAGGMGNDTYIISGGTQAQNAIGEADNAGTDTVETTLTSFSLAGFYVENLRMTGSGNSTGVGNFLANKIVSGNYNDNLSGGAGDDILFGGGNQAGGFDTLTGGAGKDSFMLRPISGSLVDITDFNVADDTIDLENYYTSNTSPVFDAALNGNKTVANPTGYGVLNSDLFRVGAAAQDANDYIIYNSTTGDLFYDQDGNGTGAALLIAHLTSRLALTNQDFVLTNILANSSWFTL